MFYPIIYVSLTGMIVLFGDNSESHHILINKKPRHVTGFFVYIPKELQGSIDAGEDVADGRAEDGQSCNNNNSYQNENQRILNEALSFFFRGE